MNVQGKLHLGITLVIYAFWEWQWFLGPLSICLHERCVFAFAHWHTANVLSPGDVCCTKIATE